MKLTAKQEKFAHNVAILGMTYHDAYIAAGYSTNTQPAALDVRASEVAANSKVSVRIREKFEEVEGPDYMSRAEMLARLTTIGRSTMADFATCSADGVWMPDYGPEHLKKQALKKIKTTTMPFKDGEDGSKVLLTEVELHDPLQAMRDIAKLRKWWGEEGNIINNYNINIEKALITAGEKLESKLNNLASRIGEKRISGKSES